MSQPSDDKVPVVEPSTSDNQSDDLTGRALRQRIRQQELLAELEVLALQRTGFIGMLNHTARMTAEGLGAEYCKVMEYMPGENRLLVRAGVGWEEGVVARRASVPIWPLLLAMLCAPASPLFRITSKMRNASEPRNCLSSTAFVAR